MTLHNSIPFVASPHFSSRRSQSVEGVVIHYTAGGRASGSVAWLADTRSKASAHFVISRSGRTVQMVELEMAAWHAGVAEMVVGGECRSDPKRFTIGIELANHGWLQKTDDGFKYEIGRSLYRYHGAEPQEATLVYDSGLEIPGWWEPYPGEQMDALDWLIKALRDKGYRKAIETLIGHESIGMPVGRKRDPGPLFPWGRFGGWENQRTKPA